MQRWVVFGLRWKYLSLLFLSPLPSRVSLYLPPPPSAGSWECSGGRPGRSSRWPVQSCHALPRGQWVSSGSSEWASLQFHYTGNWNENAVFNVKKGPCYYCREGRERQRQKEGGRERGREEYCSCQ